MQHNDHIVFARNILEQIENEELMHYTEIEILPQNDLLAAVYLASCFIGADLLVKDSIKQMQFAATKKVVSIKLKNDLIKLIAQNNDEDFKYFIDFDELYKKNDSKKYRHPLVLLEDLNVPFEFNYFYSESNYKLIKALPCLLFSYFTNENDISKNEKRIKNMDLTDENDLIRFSSIFSYKEKCTTAKNSSNNTQNILGIQKDFIKMIRFLRMLNFEGVNKTLCLFWYELHIGNLNLLLDRKEYAEFFYFTKFFKVKEYHYEIISHIYNKVMKSERLISKIYNIIKNYFLRHDPLSKEVYKLITEINDFEKIDHNPIKNKGNNISIVKKYKKDMYVWSQQNVNQITGEIINIDLKPPFDKFKDKIAGKINFRYLLFLSNSLLSMRKDVDKEKTTYFATIILQCDALQDDYYIYKDVSIKFDELVLHKFVDTKKEMPDKLIGASYVYFEEGKIKYDYYPTELLLKMTTEKQGKYIFDMSTLYAELSKYQVIHAEKIMISQVKSIEKISICKDAHDFGSRIIEYSAKDIDLENVNITGLRNIDVKIEDNYNKNDFALLCNWLRSEYRCERYYNEGSEAIKDYFCKG